MPCYCEGSECTQEPPIAEGNKGERKEDEEDCFLVHVPGEEEGGVAA